MADPVKRIETQTELQEVACQLEIGPNCLEDLAAAGLSATVHGTLFRDVGIWGAPYMVGRLEPTRGDMWVILHQDGKPVAEVNLATLFAFACGTLKG